jgi:hypothetical protein
LISGDDPGFAGVVPGLTGDVTGEAVGLPIGLAVWTGAGVATVFGLTGGTLLAAPEQAPNMATLAAKTIAKINDLLIVISYAALKVVRRERAHSLTVVFPPGITNRLLITRTHSVRYHHLVSRSGWHSSSERRRAKTPTAGLIWNVFLQATGP